jgi:aminoglycoside 3-N-acetyltransferase
VGRDSPLHRAAQWGGAVLQLGVTHTSNTTIHLIETLADLPYLYIPYRRLWGTTAIARESDGSIREIEMGREGRPGCSSGFNALGPLLEACGLTRTTQIGQCRAALTPMNEMIAAGLEALGKNMGFLLCSRPDCERCTQARFAIALVSNEDGV